ncbi:MAG: hypothetical protein K0R46_1330 [Herbinix sp.]|jgi:uncharacterized membrane protein|nr:hypothetical protein [Herbinix sp.]
MLYAEDFRRMAREALRGKWALAVITGLVAALLGAGSMGGNSGGGGGRSDGNSSGSMMWDEFSDFLSTGWGRAIIIVFIGIASMLLLWGLITFIIGGVIELGYCRFNKNLIKGNNPQFSDLFSQFNLFGKAFGLRIIKTIFIILWTLLFIIPGIVASYRYSMAFYIMDDNPAIDIMEAIRQSKAMMQGNKGRLFCLHLSFIGWAFLCIFTCGIGYLWLGPYVSAASAAFYLEVSGQRSNQQPQNVVVQ